MASQQSKRTLAAKKRSVADLQRIQKSGSLSAAASRAELARRGIALERA